MRKILFAASILTFLLACGETENKELAPVADSVVVSDSAVYVEPVLEDSLPKEPTDPRIPIK